jgi:hypothetical protein
MAQGLQQLRCRAQDVLLLRRSCCRSYFTVEDLYPGTSWWVAAAAQHSAVRKLSGLMICQLMTAVNAKPDSRLRSLSACQSVAAV